MDFQAAEVWLASFFKTKIYIYISGGVLLKGNTDFTGCATAVCGYVVRTREIYIMSLLLVASCTYRTRVINEEACVEVFRGRFSLGLGCCF